VVVRERSVKCGAIQKEDPISWATSLTFKTVTWLLYFTDWLIQAITIHSSGLVWEDWIFVLLHATELFTPLINLDSIWATQRASNSFWHWMIQCTKARKDITITECRLCQVLTNTDTRIFMQQLPNNWVVANLVNKVHPCTDTEALYRSYSPYGE
jgi:hypothetical protein